ncbi:olfactory receptor 7G2 [Fukomys damarensis]|uniref:Olfactory receptor n=1 Tax=Fukomys damarensis TaxID=885580 RepID=A0A091DGS7_FUKDA|nr:olfactory receptor 7G2 [Fukomys damarensis]XP_010606210.1 olfactory receptor 7G2 [Fukomys damarensis]KFO22006.1 Olfactory receptor 7G1 [Fukomys damarensis]KFO22007.1 Olfactory receptor 7G1 [Fukomys damarensis]
MKPTNQTTLLEFHLLGLTDDPELQPLIFSLFLSVYLVTILGNVLIILAISSDSHLHTPMYFFLSNLSFTDISVSTTVLPKMLVNTQAKDPSITYIGCLFQAYFALLCSALENCLLAVMACDRYVAICHPLRYTIVVHPGLCVLLVLLSLLISTVHTLIHTLTALRLSFCTDLDIPHFFCELAQVIKLSCSDTFINNLLVYLAGIIFFGVPLFGIIFSYIQIVSSILKIPSVGGRYKAFSTCGSHLSVVSLFYGTGFGVYMSSAVTDSSIKNVVASVMYIVIPPTLNPLIYSLRNKEMKRALRSLIVGISLV